MNFTNIQENGLVNLINFVLSNTEKKPFNCVELSCVLASSLLDYFKCNAKVITGDLVINGNKIFTQNYPLNNLGDKDFIGEWDGHSWVLLDDRYIIDISLGRTVDSDVFQSKHKKLNLDEIKGKGCVIIDCFNNSTPLNYFKRSEVPDKLITAIIQPFLTRIDSKYK